MNIQAINPSFQGKRDRVDAFINMDDESVRKLAYMKTAVDTNPDKNRKITNALFYSAPIAAGLGAALLSENGNTKMFSKQLTGTAGRMANGLKVAAFWTAALGAIDLLGAARKKLSDNSPQVRKFDREHPLLSIGTSLAAGFGVLALLYKGAGKLGAKKAPKFMQKSTQKVANFLNEAKIMAGAKNAYKKFLSKTPHALKEIGATVLSFAPTALLFGGLFHSIGSKSAENREFVKNYTEIKDKQARLAKARLRELSMENHFFKQDAKNRDDLALVKNPLKDLPPEVIEKVQNINES